MTIYNVLQSTTYLEGSNACILGQFNTNKEAVEYIKKRVSELNLDENCTSDYSEKEDYFTYNDDDGLIVEIFVQVTNICAGSWICSPDDFEDRFDTSNIDESELKEMVEEVTDRMNGNECVSDCYWLTIDEVAEEHGLSKLGSKENIENSIEDFLGKDVFECEKMLKEKYGELFVRFQDERIKDGIGEGVYLMERSFGVRSDENHDVRLYYGSDDYILTDYDVQ